MEDECLNLLNYPINSLQTNNEYNISPRNYSQIFEKAKFGIFEESEYLLGLNFINNNDKSFYNNFANRKKLYEEEIYNQQNLQKEMNKLIADELNQSIDMGIHIAIEPDSQKNENEILKIEKKEDNIFSNKDTKLINKLSKVIFKTKDFGFLKKKKLNKDKSTSSNNISSAINAPEIHKTMKIACINNSQKQEKEIKLGAIDSHKPQLFKCFNSNKKTSNTCRNCNNYNNNFISDNKINIKEIKLKQKILKNLKPQNERKNNSNNLYNLQYGKSQNIKNIKNKQNLGNDVINKINSQEHEFNLSLNTESKKNDILNIANNAYTNNKKLNLGCLSSSFDSSGNSSSFSDKSRSVKFMKFKTKTHKLSNDYTDKNLLIQSKNKTVTENKKFEVKNNESHILTTLPNADDKHNKNIISNIYSNESVIHSGKIYANSNINTDKTKVKIKWSEAEDKKLIKIKQDFPYLIWQQVSQFFENRTKAECMNRYLMVINPNLKKGKWTNEEDEILTNWVVEHGASNWGKLSNLNLIKGRNCKQIRDRWINVLSLKLKKVVWNEQTERILLEKYLLYGSCWTKISEFIKDSSENIIKNKFYSMLRKTANKYTKNKANNSLSLHNIAAPEHSEQAKEIILLNNNNKHIYYNNCENNIYNNNFPNNCSNINMANAVNLSTSKLKINNKKQRIIEKEVIDTYMKFEEYDEYANTKDNSIYPTSRNSIAQNSFYQDFNNIANTNVCHNNPYSSYNFNSNEKFLTQNKCPDHQENHLSLGNDYILNFANNKKNKRIKNNYSFDILIKFLPILLQEKSINYGNIISCNKANNDSATGNIMHISEKNFFNINKKNNNNNKDEFANKNCKNYNNNNTQGQIASKNDLKTLYKLNDKKTSNNLTDLKKKEILLDCLINQFKKKRDLIRQELIKKLTQKKQSQTNKNYSNTIMNSNNNNNSVVNLNNLKNNNNNNNKNNIYSANNNFSNIINKNDLLFPEALQLKNFENQKELANYNNNFAMNISHCSIANNQDGNISMLKNNFILNNAFNDSFISNENELNELNLLNDFNNKNNNNHIQNLNFSNSNNSFFNSWNLSDIIDFENTLINNTGNQGLNSLNQIISGNTTKILNANLTAGDFKNNNADEEYNCSNNNLIKHCKNFNDCGNINSKADTNANNVNYYINNNNYNNNINSVSSNSNANKPNGMNKFKSSIMFNLQLNLLNKIIEKIKNNSVQRFFSNFKINTLFKKPHDISIPDMNSNYNLTQNITANEKEKS